MPLVLVLLVLTLVPALPAAPAYAGDAWVAPLDPPLSVARAFDPPAERWLPGHRGVDLASWAGAPVYATGPGTVTFAGLLAGRGVVTVTHGALRTTYEPVTPVLASGATVVAGEVVASLEPGHGGTSPPDALLHWGLLRGEEYLDPLSLLRRGPSRLVPVDPASSPDALAGPAAPDARHAAAFGTADLVSPTPPDPPPVRPVARAAAMGGLGAMAMLAALRRRVRRRSHDPRDPRDPRGGGDPRDPRSPRERGDPRSSRGGGDPRDGPRRVSPAGPRAFRGAGVRPWYASGRSGSRSRRGPGRSPPA